MVALPSASRSRVRDVAYGRSGVAPAASLRRGPCTRTGSVPSPGAQAPFHEALQHQLGPFEHLGEQPGLGTGVDVGGAPRR
jgi:hypothetical protein